MINTRRREQLELEINQALREYSRAQYDLNRFKIRVAELALAGEDISDQLREKIDSAEQNILYWPEQLEILKTQYCEMIQHIRLD